MRTIENSDLFRFPRVSSFSGCPSSVTLQDFEIRLDTYRSNLQEKELLPAVNQSTQTPPAEDAPGKANQGGKDVFEKRSMERCQELLGQSLKELRVHYNMQMRVNLAEVEALYDGKMKNLQEALDHSSNLGTFAFDLVRMAKTTIDEKNDRIRELEGINSELRVAIAALNDRIYHLKELVDAEVAKSVPEDIFRAWEREVNRQREVAGQEREQIASVVVADAAAPVTVPAPVADPITAPAAAELEAVSVPVNGPDSAPVADPIVAPASAAVADLGAVSVPVYDVSLPVNGAVYDSVTPVSVPSSSPSPIHEECNNNNNEVAIEDSNETDPLPNVSIPKGILEEYVGKGLKRKLHNMEEGQRDEANGPKEKYNFTLEVCPEGKYIKVLNGGGTEVQMRGWVLVHSSEGYQTKYKFSRNTNLKPFTEVTVWSMDSREADRLLISNHFLRDKKWIIAEAMKTELFDANRECVAVSVRGELRP